MKVNIWRTNTFSNFQEIRNNKEHVFAVQVLVPHPNEEDSKYPMQRIQIAAVGLSLN